MVRRAGDHELNERTVGAASKLARLHTEARALPPPRMHDAAAEEQRLHASVDAALIGQNVYLCCASEGLGTVFRGAIDQAGPARLLGLDGARFVSFAQTVGYPDAESAP